MQECKYASILSPNIFDLNPTWPKLFQTERTRQLAHLPSFCELVFFALAHCHNDDFCADSRFSCRFQDQAKRVSLLCAGPGFTENIKCPLFDGFPKTMGAINAFPAVNRFLKTSFLGAAPV